MQETNYAAEDKKRHNKTETLKGKEDTFDKLYQIWPHISQKCLSNSKSNSLDVCKTTNKP